MYKSILLSAVTALLCGSTISAQTAVRRSVTPSTIGSCVPAAQARVERPEALLAPAATATDAIFTMHPTEDEFNACTLIDANGDGSTIEYYYAVSGNNVFDWPIYYANNSTQLDADEWLITPGVALTDVSKLYELSIDARVGGTNMPEAFDVWVGTAPTVAAMTRQAIDQPSFVNTEFETFSGTFGIDAPGTYYIGVHIKSTRQGSWRLMLRDLRLSLSNATASTPGEVTDVVAKADATGALNATVTFRMPTMAVNGVPLSSSDDVTATVASPKEAKTVTGKPGSQQSVTVATVAGDNIITLTTSNALGTGLQTKVTVTCGVDKPVNPEVTAEVSADNMTLTLTWPPVTEGQTGGVIRPDEMTYNVYRYEVVDYGDSGTQASWNLFKSGLTESRFTFTATDATQQLYEFLVTAKNSAGETDGDVCSLGAGHLGKPYTLPFAEDFSTGHINYQGYLIQDTETSDVVTWGFSTASQMVADAGTVGALIGYSSATTAAVGAISSPRFSTKGVRNMQLTVTAYVDDAIAPTEVSICTPQGECESLGEITRNSGSGWTTMNFRVPSSFDDLGTAYILFSSSLPSYLYHFMVCAYSVRPMQAHDLALVDVKFDAPVIGEAATVTARVRNVGYSPATIGSLTGTITTPGGTKVADVTFETAPSKQLAENEEAEVKGSFLLRTADHLASTLYIDVQIAAADDDNSNNAATASFTLRGTNGPIVTDLTGEEDADGTGVLLTWSDPTAGLRTESFEYMTHGDYSTTLGQFTNIDFDHAAEWGIDGVDIPFQGMPKGFQVINAAVMGSSYPAHSGQQYLLTFSVDGGQSDDWLISPEIVAADGFSFWINILHPDYPETLEVMTSSTDTDMDSFTVVKTVKATTFGWQKIDVELPASTRYVALHYASYDQFGLMVDDITYAPASSDYEVMGYNLYRNGELFKTLLSETEYYDVHEEYFTNRYNVSIVAERDGQMSEHPLSNTFCLKTAGVTEVNAAHSSASAIYDLQGRRLKSTIAPGLYIINGKKTFIK